jgi:hypothetical protein
MIAMLRLPRVNLDERRKAHLRRKLYNFTQEHSGDLAFLALVVCAVFFGVVVWYTKK